MLILFNSFMYIVVEALVERMSLTLVNVLFCLAIFAADSATRPRADVAYCINALAKRLAKTHNWAVYICSPFT